MHGIVLPHGMKELCLSFEEKNALALGQGPPPRGRSLAYPRCLRVLKEGICFQGDEASPMTPDHKPEVSGKAGEPVEVQAASQAASLPHWYALYTRSHCEQLVADQLAAKGFQVFLPKLETWSQRAGRQHLISLPMFPSYLFLHHAMDKTSYIEVRNARGLVRILRERWDRLGVIPAAEIEAIQKAVVARFPLFPHPYLKEGQRVHITHGPLAGMEGILVQSKPAKGLLVLSVELLQRCIAVQVAYSMT
jgi:transcription antitermination factor NusG